MKTMVKIGSMEDKTKFPGGVSIYLSSNNQKMELTSNYFPPQTAGTFLYLLPSERVAVMEEKHLRYPRSGRCETYTYKPYRESLKLIFLPQNDQNLPFFNIKRQFF